MFCGLLSLQYCSWSWLLSPRSSIFWQHWNNIALCCCSKCWHNLSSTDCNNANWGWSSRVCPVMPLFLPCNEAVHGMELVFLAKFLEGFCILCQQWFIFFLSLALCREQSSILSQWVSINFDCCLVDNDDFFSSIRLFFIDKQNGWRTRSSIRIL